MGWYQIISAPLTCVVCGGAHPEPEIQIPHPHVTPGWAEDPEPPLSFVVGTPLHMGLYDYSCIFFHLRAWSKSSLRCIVLLEWECRRCVANTCTLRWALATFTAPNEESACVLASLVAAPEIAETLQRADWLHWDILCRWSELEGTPILSRAELSALKLGQQLSAELMARISAHLNAQRPHTE